MRQFTFRTKLGFDLRKRNWSIARAFNDPLLDGPAFAGFGSWANARKFIRHHPLPIFLSLLIGSFALFGPQSNPWNTRLPHMISVTEAVQKSVVPAASAEPAPLLPVPQPPMQQMASLSIPPALSAAEAGPKTVEAVPEIIRFPDLGYCLLACKRDRTLYAYKRTADKTGIHWEKAAAFPMAFGRKSGDKSEAGDMRTPEGRFWIVGLSAGPTKGPAYGPLAFTLNYPRPEDAAEGKSGEGIWIHGVEAGKLPTYTHGCLSLANVDVLTLTEYADIGTPVLILPDSLSPAPAEQLDWAGLEREYPAIMTGYGRRNRADTLAKAAVLQQARAFVAKEAKENPDLALESISPDDKKAILARLSRWREDWTHREISAYGANYDADFRDSQGRDKQDFLDRKRKIFASKSSIAMEIIDPKIEAEGYAQVKVTFRQDYTAQGPQGLQRSSSTKSLHMEQGPAGWLIITE